MILGVLLIALAAAVLFYWGRAVGYHAGFEDGYGARWGRHSPGDGDY